MPSSETTPKKRSSQKKKSRRSGSLFFRSFVTLLILLVVGVTSVIAWAFLPAGRSGQEVMIEIPNNATARQIATLLKEEGIIRSDDAFLVMARLLGETGHMQPGDYPLRNNMTLAQIITLLTRGDNTAKWVTIPEGYTLRQVADTLEDKGLGDASRIYRISRMGGESFKGLSFNPPQNLEGYLFPDTYKLSTNATERQIVEELLKTFDRKVAEPLADEFEAAKRKGRSMEEIVIIASMVEREALAKREQPMVAAVIENRLERGMRLQIDATVQYALAAPKKRLNYDDLKVPSPYNTYRIDGLPPGPISNPGLDAIKAVLNPADIDALYYVAKPDGTHIFTRTLDEHNAAKRRVKRMAQ